MGFSFKMVSNQNLASLVWLKSEPSLEWLLPLWAVPKLQNKGCWKPRVRSRYDFLSFKISFFPQLIPVLHSKPNCITPCSLIFLQCNFGGSHFPSTPCLMFGFPNSHPVASGSPAFLSPDVSTCSADYLPTGDTDIVVIHYPSYWPQFPSQTPWILSLVTLIPLHQIHTFSPQNPTNPSFPLVLCFYAMLNPSCLPFIQLHWSFPPISSPALWHFA